MMYARIVLESIRRGAKTRLTALAAVALGAGAAGALVMLLMGVGDRMAAEMRRTGANIEILPKADGLKEDDLPALRETFWKLQIVRVIPELRFPCLGYVVVGRELDPAWRVEGTPGVLAGVSLGLSAGTQIDLGRRLRVTGTVATGGEEDGEILLPLPLAQDLAGKRGVLSRVLVSAITKPETDEFRQFLKRPRAYTPQEEEQMRCTNFPTNVARDFGLAMNGDARVIRRVAETEGALLQKIEAVVWVMAAAAVLAAGLSVLGAMTASIVERRKEVGLLKALGATNGVVAGLFLGEAAILGILGSVAGYAIGLGAAKSMSASLFGNPVPGSVGVYLVTLAAAMAIVAAGAAWPLRRVFRLSPHVVLHEV